MRSSRRWLSLVGALATVFLLAGCAPGGSIRELPASSGFDYQLGGSYSPPAGVTILIRDSTARPVAGLYNICYVNGFQSQGGDKNLWLTKHPSLVLRSAAGAPVFDPGWPDEMILDVRTPAKRAAIAGILGATIDSCRARGFQAVEFDNLDSYSRSRHAFTLASDVAMAVLFVEHAHKVGLAAGQKNTAELGSRGRDVVHFDFAVAEECYRYAECAAYTRVYGARVLDIECTDDLRGSFKQNCAAASIPARTILRDRDLRAKGDEGYVYRQC